MLDDDDERRIISVHRTINTQETDHPRTPSISALRRKFEINVHRKPSQNLRHAKDLSRSISPKVVNYDDDDEPEFIKIGRRIRRNSMLLEDSEDNYKAAQQKNMSEMSKSEVPKVSYNRRVAEIPRLSRSARIVRDDSHENPNLDAQATDMTSPPDPDSARQRRSPTTDITPVMFVCTDDLQLNTDPSPPPEEPKPSKDINNADGSNHNIVKPCMFTNRKSIIPQVTPPQIIPKNNDDSGIFEMMRLLDKFQRARGSRLDEIWVNKPERTTSIDSSPHNVSRTVLYLF
ncbi:hypothetical protein DICVIV_10334 [Dictyocaulus viviparus]|uniref:Uncharacterized protein n=1 Tax=Dictyocaulus viviparus TaxID=29172 RepID=A0A0D8XG95_DICVI|nr:hypothetical protein DICVIV_10334 [Dictyocaulus viviparus]